MTDRYYDRGESRNDEREGRFGGRDEGFRDQSNRGSREWDRRGDDFREYRAGRDERELGYPQPGYAEEYFRHQARERDLNQPWREEQERFHNQDFRRSPEEWRGSGPDYGQRQRGYAPRPQESYGPRRDYHQRTFAREWSRAQDLSPSPTYGQQDWGVRGHGHDDWRGGSGWREQEGWGQQLREAGQQVARSVKRVFRGPKGYKRSDERIREDVSDRLAQAYQVDPSEIEVTVSNGEVTLSGSVQSRHEKFYAEEIADDVSGVSDVHNQLRVRREEVGQTGVSTAGTQVGTIASETTLRNRNARA